MNRIYATFCAIVVAMSAHAQSNIHFTNPEAADVFAGNYQAANYTASTVYDDPNTIVSKLNSAVNTDSLYSYLRVMASFETRHTSSDTISSVRGIGAARRWAHKKFEQFSQDREGRLVVSYLRFDQNICGVNQHSNIVAMLPGRQAESGAIILEAHIDSRCDTPCDTNCLAEGMEDNGSGSALVLELARTMSEFTFDRTIVFMLTIGEEQGLYGADAMADYAKDHGIDVVAVLNNDVIGGITCGKTSSPPSCPSENHIDSTQVRLFSSGTFGSAHKQLARYVKLQYKEELLPHVKVPMQVTIMTAEDRTGRGGDHIPFRMQGFSAIRFTAANEHGDASNDVGYEDRQHTSDDVLGKDTDGDGLLDSFYVDFNYLARNAVINGNAAAMLARNICSDITFTAEQINWHQVKVSIEGDSCAAPPYRIAVRTSTNDWDSVYFTKFSDIIIEVEPGVQHFISVARVDGQGIEDMFSNEVFMNILGTDDENTPQGKGIELLQNKPNPFDESTAIAFLVHDMPASDEALVRIADISGKVVKEISMKIKPGLNEVVYNHGYGKVGTYVYSLMVGEDLIDSRKMVFVAY